MLKYINIKWNKETYNHRIGLYAYKLNTLKLYQMSTMHFKNVWRSQYLFGQQIFCETCVVNLTWRTVKCICLPIEMREYFAKLTGIF